MQSKGETTSLATDRKEILVLIKESNRFSSIPVASNLNIYMDEILSPERSVGIPVANVKGLRVNPK